MDKTDGSLKIPSPTYSYTNEQTVDEELKCPVCLEPLVSPAVCSYCRNTFCRTCVESEKMCPICRGNVSLQEPPRLLLNLLGKLTVKCNVCSKEVKRGDFSTHVMQECPIKCSWGCNAIVTRSTLETHKNVCPYKMIQCLASDVGCTFVSTKSSMDNHLRICPYLNLQPLLQAQQNRIQQLEKKVQTLEKLNNITQNSQLKRPLTIKFTPPPAIPLRRERESESEESEEDEEDEIEQYEEIEVPRVMTSIQRRKKRHKS